MTTRTLTRTASWIEARFVLEQSLAPALGQVLVLVLVLAHGQGQELAWADVSPEL